MVMTGPEHYREAERMAGHCAVDVADADGEDVEVSDITRAYISVAQVHATLALAAATALNTPHPEGGMTIPDWDGWVEAASAYERPARAMPKAPARHPQVTFTNAITSCPTEYQQRCYPDTTAAFEAAVTERPYNNTSLSLGWCTGNHDTQE